MYTVEYVEFEEWSRGHSSKHCLEHFRKKGLNSMKKSIKETAREVILPTVTELGYEIWDVTYSKIGADYHLEITIDHENGIDIQDCEKVHRAIEPILDQCELIESVDYLDVSSPGIERELRTEEHILWGIGQKVEAKLFAAHQGQKSIIGNLESFEDGKLTIKNDAGEYVLEKSAVSKLTTIFFED
jgi:ribosome maturation factor RimP